MKNNFSGYKIKAISVGGGGCNALNNIVDKGIKDVESIAKDNFAIFECLCKLNYVSFLYPHSRSNRNCSE